MDVSDELQTLVSERDREDRVEVLFGLNEEYAVGALTDRLGEDGKILNHAGFGIYRAAVTVERLTALLDDEPNAIDFVERGRRMTGGLPNE